MCGAADVVQVEQVECRGRLPLLTPGGQDRTRWGEKLVELLVCNLEHLHRLGGVVGVCLQDKYVMNASPLIPQHCLLARKNCAIPMILLLAELIVHYINYTTVFHKYFV